MEKWSLSFGEMWVYSCRHWAGVCEEVHEEDAIYQSFLSLAVFPRVTI